ncbi:unnamed protein product, partial [Heterosigma akashiwo]
PHRRPRWGLVEHRPWARLPHQAVDFQWEQHKYSQKVKENDELLRLDAKSSIFTSFTVIIVFYVYMYNNSEAFEDFHSLLLLLL